MMNKLAKRKNETIRISKLVIEEHEGFHIVRDDLLEGGSKRRFVDRMIREEIAEGAEEFVYGGCPKRLCSIVFNTTSKSIW